MNKPNLKGLHVLNTRPVEQAKPLSQAIEAAGGIVISCPALTIKAKDRAWLRELPDLNTVAKAIFISANAVNYCFEALNCPWPSTIQVIAIGDATAAALAHFGITADSVPAISDSENLLKQEALQEVKDQLILLFKGENGRTLITETLKARGANLQHFDVYKRILPKLDPQQLASLWQNEVVDIILITSQQAMNNLFTLFGEEAQTWLCSTPFLVVSERLAKEAALLGIQKIVVSDPKAILTTLHQFNQGLMHG